jgi:hypothetical protein
MTQDDLFDDRNLSRKKDPSTSHLAEAELKASGRLGVLARQTLRDLRDLGYPTGAVTASELARRSCVLSDETPHKRLPDLRAKGLAVNRDRRVCACTGRLCMTWGITAKGRLWLMLGDD